jgi:DNA-binding GntR family transcriptional regulator
MRELSMRSAVITMLYQSRRDATCSSDEHRAFIDAAKAGDADLAVSLMVEHLNHVESALHFDEIRCDARQGLVAALLA